MLLLKLALTLCPRHLFQLGPRWFRHNLLQLHLRRYCQHLKLRLRSLPQLPAMVHTLLLTFRPSRTWNTLRKASAGAFDGPAACRAKPRIHWHQKLCPRPLFQLRCLPAIVYTLLLLLHTVPHRGCCQTQTRAHLLSLFLSHCKKLTDFVVEVDPDAITRPFESS